MAIAGLVISILAILFTLYTYCKHDKKIKDQTKLINDYQLQKIEKESIEEKKAKIKTEIEVVDNGNKILVISNVGKSIAKDLDVTFSENEDLYVLDNPCPINLNPTNNIRISMLISEFCSNKQDITIKWKDDFSEKNNETQTLQI